MPLTNHKEEMFNEKERVSRLSVEREKQKQIRKARASLLERFRPPVPESLLPKDPRPNYRPQYLQAVPHVVHGAPRYGCTSCDFRYDSERLLRVHCESRHDGRASDRRRRDEAAKGKEPTPVDLKPVAGNSSAKKCPHCDSVLAYAYNLSKHIENRHNIPTGRHHCRLCGFKGETKDALQRHRESRHRRCPYCHIRFTTERGMNRHIHDCPSGPRNGRS